MSDVILAIVWFVVLVAVLGFLFGCFVFLLWNWLMPDLFGLSQITYIQAVGLFWLFGLLTKSVIKTD